MHLGCMKMREERDYGRLKYKMKPTSCSYKASSKNVVPQTVTARQYDGESWCLGQSLFRCLFLRRNIDWVLVHAVWLSDNL